MFCSLGKGREAHSFLTFELIKPTKSVIEEVKKKTLLANCIKNSHYPLGMNVASLTPEQKQHIVEWVAGGADLNSLQKHIVDKLGIRVTYMDTRLLILDLGLELIPAPEPQTPHQQENQTPASSSAEDLAPASTDAVISSSTVPLAGKLDLSIDEKPADGFALTGKVTFPSGSWGAWFFDHEGRLGLDPAPTAAEPTEEDIDVFQRELKHFLRTQMGGL